MKSLVLTIALAAALSAVLAAPVAAEESETKIRRDIRQNAEAFLLVGDFRALNGIAETFRLADAKTPSGQSKLEMFYFGIGYGATGHDTEGRAEGRVAMAERWLKQAPSTPAVIGLALAHISLGWIYRGYYSVKDTPRENFPKFYEQLRIAEKILTEHKDAAEDPEWFVAVERVAVQERVPAELRNGLFDQGAAKFPDYQGLYFSRLRNAEPRYGGNIQEMRMIAEYAEARTMKKMGSEMYARLFWDLLDDGYGIDKDGRTLLEWERAKRGFSDLIKHYPTVWNRNGFAYVSCRMRDPDAGKLLEDIRTPLPELWGDYMPLFEQCRGWTQPAH